MSDAASARFLVGCAGRGDAGWLDRLDASALGAGGARLARASASAISTLEGDWPGGGIGLWRFDDADAVRIASASAGPPEPGGFAVSVPERSGAAAAATGGGFILVQGLFTDAAKAVAYNQALPPIYVRYGGSYLALSRPDAIELLAGQWSPRAVVIAAFASPEGPQTFWRSPEYTAAKALRAGGGQFLVIAFPGVKAGAQDSNQPQREERS